jgi:hypothetical protein
MRAPWDEAKYLTTRFEIVMRGADKEGKVAA